MDFIQVYHQRLLPSEIVDKLKKEIPVIENSDMIQGDMAQLPIQFENMYSIMDPYVQDYVRTLQQRVNYFPSLPVKYQMLTKAVHIPEYTYHNYSWDPGHMLNFHVYIEDGNASLEFYNPFADEFVKYKPHKGLVVIFPSFWGVIYRHTSTLNRSQTYIAGTLNLVNLNNVK